MNCMVILRENPRFGRNHNSDVRHTDRMTLDDYLTIRPLCFSNKGKKMGKNGRRRVGESEKRSKSGQKNGANARNRTEDLFITRCKAYLLPIVNIEVVTVFF